MRYEGNSALLNTVGIFYFYGIRHDLKLKMAKKKTDACVKITGS